MEITLSSATAKSYLGSLSPDSLMLKRSKLSQWDQYSISFSQTRRIEQALFGQAVSLSRKNNSVKVISCKKKEAFIVEGSSIDEIYDALASRLLPTAAVTANPDYKYIVGLAGPPGSGKTTLASEVVQRLNKLWLQKASSLDSQVKPLNVATALPMDGFHLYRSQLDAMEDPEEAHARRGAPWTFNPELLLTCLKTLRNRGSVSAPSFDHGVGDPVEDGIFVSLEHKVVIVEGNYLFLEDGTWKEISALFDEKWFIDIDIDKAMQRVVERHILTGKPPDVAKWRIEYNDRPNAELIMKSKRKADLVIRSVDF